MGMLSEFKQFAMRGNVVDLAIGVVIGGAFGKVVSSLVADMIMPPLSLVLSQVNFTDWVVTLREKTATSDAVALNIGIFLTTVIDFLIVAAAIFAVVKLMNTLQRKKEAAPAPPPEPSREEKLLAEIRDLLKSRA
jgi:large conductance mechanosensitive channel